MTAISLFSVHEAYEKIAAIRAQQNITFSFHFRSMYIASLLPFTCLTPHLQLNIIRKVIILLFFRRIAKQRSKTLLLV